MRQYDQIAAALATAQAKFVPASRDKENPFHKSRYAGLDSVMAVIRQPLAESGLCVTQTFDHRLDGLVLRTTLIHTSGQYITSTLRMNPAKSDPQGIGSAITYARRYALAAMLGVVSDDDDDGNAAMNHNGHHDAVTNIVIKPGPVAKAASETDIDTIRLFMKNEVFTDDERAKMDSELAAGISHARYKAIMDRTQQVIRDRRALAAEAKQVEAARIAADGYTPEAHELFPIEWEGLDKIDTTRDHTHASQKQIDWFNKLIKSSVWTPDELTLINAAWKDGYSISVASYLCGHLSTIIGKRKEYISQLQAA